MSCFPASPGSPAPGLIGVGLEELRLHLSEVAGSLAGRADAAVSGVVVLHIDRTFSIGGAGTVVTGTLWSGTVQ